MNFPLCERVKPCVVRTRGAVRDYPRKAWDEAASTDSAEAAKGRGLMAAVPESSKKALDPGR